MEKEKIESCTRIIRNINKVSGEEEYNIKNYIRMFIMCNDIELDKLINDFNDIFKQKATERKYVVKDIHGLKLRNSIFQYVMMESLEKKSLLLT